MVEGSVKVNTVESTKTIPEENAKESEEYVPVENLTETPILIPNQDKEKNLTEQLEELKHGKKIDLPFEQLFPHEIIRKGQEELVKDLDQTLKEKKVLIAHAPTGMGKTAAALSVALRHAFKERKTVFFLTNRHTQHRIAIQTLRLMQKRAKTEIPCVDLIGKKHMCNQEVAGLYGNEFNEYCKYVVEKGECEFYNNVKSKKKDVNVEAMRALSELKKKSPLHNEEVVEYCKEKRLCSYEMASLLAKGAKVLIGDYYYLFNPFISGNLLLKMNKEIGDIILILDEGHNLPGRIAEMLSNMLTNNMLKNGILEAKRFHFEGIISWLQELNRILNEFAQFPESEKYAKEKKITKEQFLEEVNKFTNYDNFTEELEFAADEVRKKQRKSYLGGIAAFLISWKGQEEGFVRYISQRNSRYGEITALTYACLDPSIITKDIFQFIHAGIIMSGTLKPTFMYKDVLGINSRAVEKEYISPFPPENKLSIIIPETSTKYTLRNELMYQKIGEKCSELCKLIPGNVALFFPAYNMRDQIGKYIKSPKKLFWEKQEMNKKEKETLLEEFKMEKDSGAVLLGVAGANFAEGIDLPGDLLNGVVIVGLPLAKPNLVTREMIAYLDKKFNRGWDYGYTYPAMNKCFQSAGRCIRSETDKGVVIYLDERFTWQSYFCCFNREGLIVSKEYTRLLDNFFGK